MAQHDASGKHSAGNHSSDRSSQETKKIETNKSAASASSSAPTEKIKTASPDQTKEMPRAAKTAAKTADKGVKAAAPAAEKKTVKPVTTGAAEAEAAQQKKRTGIIAAIVIIVVLIAAVIGFMAMNSNKPAEVQNNDMEVVDVESEPVDNPVDFAALQAQNPDVYGFMNIPNTNVDLPILFNAENDNYYLTHDIDGNSTIVGAIYTQSMNKQDFTDPVTVLYGHTLLNGTMFSELHKFEDPEFFEQNPYFTIYLPNEILTYEAMAALEYDDKHIMNTYDFTNETVVQEFFDSMQHPEAANSLVREGEELKADTDKIVVLSTCTQPANDAKRFLLVGKLMSRQPTK